MHTLMKRLEHTTAGAARCIAATEGNSRNEVLARAAIFTLLDGLKQRLKEL
jgi:hypothetical protein